MLERDGPRKIAQREPPSIQERLGELIWTFEPEMSVEEIQSVNRGGRIAGGRRRWFNTNINMHSDLSIYGE